MDIKSFLNSFKMKVPEGGSSQFYIGNTQVIPSANIEGSVQSNAQIPLGTLDGEEIYGARDRKTAFGNVGLNFVTPTSMVDNVPTTFGVGASGQYYTQEDKYPEVLKQFNVPDSQKFGNGLTVDQLNAYLNTPLSENVDLGVNARISPYYTDPVDGRMLGKDKYIGGEIRYKF